MKRLLCFPGSAPDILYHDLALPHPPPELHGRPIAFLSDLHYGFFLGDDAMARIFDMVMAHKPCLILLGGDLADSLPRQRRLCEGPLRMLKAPLGVYCVPGNNDYEAVKGDYRILRASLDRAGVRLLVNERLHVPLDTMVLAITVLDEGKYGSPDPAVAKLPLPSPALHLLLTHSPWSLAAVLPDAPRTDLILCGHTHGGQIALPVLPALAMGYLNPFKQPYFFMSGERTLLGRRIIVSNGVGCSLLPLRVFAPPQLHFITIS